MYEACSGRYAEQRAGSEDDALEVVASMITRIRESGVLPLQKMSLGEKMAQAAAFSRLAQPPTNRMLAEALTHEVFTAFLPTLQRFQADLQAAEPDTRLEPLLQRLCESYNTVYDVLAEWCQQLCVAEAAEELHVRLRCALLQPDLLTLEAPPGRAELLRFLRQHAMTWLEQRQQQQQEKKEVLKGGTSADTSGRRSSKAHATSSAAASHRPSRNRPVRGDDSGGGTDDVVMRCLHGLTLSRTRELRQLWQSVLETCIEARVSAQADDDDEEDEENVSVHTLPSCLAWHESVVHHFVHMALPLPKAHNTNSLLVLPQSVDTTTTRDSGRGVQHERRLSNTSHTATAMMNGDGVSAIRAARAEWCAQLRQKLLTSYARRRLAVFWDLLVDYPDSTPVLEDVRYCLQACPDNTLRNELIHTVRHLLAARLHRAGTRTEDILSVLSKTIHSLCVLLPRSEQSSVIFSVVSDTLDHLRRRKDCVSTIVKAITQPRSDVSLFDGSTPFAAAAATENASNADDDDDEGIDSELDDEEPPNKATHDDMTDEYEDDETPMHTKRESTAVSGQGWRRAGHAKPDVLRVLLTAIRVKVLAQEYQQVLAEQLLTKPMHGFDVSAEEEVLERLKCVFGEEALTGCVIMLHDVERSRRITTQLRDMLKQHATRHDDEEGSEEDDEEEDDDDDEPRVMAGRASMCLPARRSTLLTHTPPPQTPAPPALLPAEALSLHVLSMTAWPRLTQSPAGTPPIPEHFIVHPALQSEMDRIARVYREVKVNRKLVWLCAQGHVELELMQQQASSPSNLRRQLRDKASCEGCAHGEAQGDNDDEEGVHSTGMRPVTYTLSLFAASIVLFVKDLEAAAGTRVQSGGTQPAVTVAAVAAKMRIAENVLQPHLAALMPAILTHDKAGGLIVQTHAVTASGQFVFDEAAIDTAEGDTGATNSSGGSSATPAGLSAEQLKMLQLMIAAMLKAGGPKSVNEIHNSMKIFGQFTGTVAEMKRLLLQLVSSGTLVMDSAKQLFSLPPH